MHMELWLVHLVAVDKEPLSGVLLNRQQGKRVVRMIPGNQGGDSKQMEREGDEKASKQHCSRVEIRIGRGRRWR